MRLLLLASIVAVSAACARGPAAPAPTPLATPADSAAVVGTLTRMFDALRTKDVAAFRAEFHPAGRFTLLRPTPGGPDSVGVVVLPLAQFVQAALGPTGSASPWTGRWRRPGRSTRSGRRPVSRIADTTPSTS
jgi:hypothetical protein